MKTTTTTHTASPARQFLRLASAKLKPIAQATGKTVNELLTAQYSNRAHAREWDTFRGWKKRGYYVAKSERGFAVWSRPISAAEAAEAETTATDAATDAESATPARESFYVAYIFCAAQVKDRDGYTPDGKEYTPTNLTPPHCQLADTTDTTPATTDTTATPATEPQPETPATTATPKPQPAADAPAVKYVQQLALAI